VHPLEERIGYKFRNPLLLAEALTHPSLGHETQQRHFDNQRLEFLGDAILQLVITEYLFGHFGDQPEGQLTKLRSRLVSRDALKAHAAALDLGQFLLMGRGEEASGGRARISTLADAFEAVIGAIYLDGGLEKTRRFILAQANKIWPSSPRNRSISIPKGICRNCCKAFRRGAPFMKSFRRPDLNMTNDSSSRQSGRESFSEKVTVEARSRRRQRRQRKRWN